MMPGILKRFDFVFVGLFSVAIYFSPVIFSDRTFFFRDIHRFFFPMKFFLAKSLKEGTFPFWCANYFCGVPFLNDIQSGVFYPLSILFALLPFPRSFNGYVLIHFFLGISFFYLFIRSLGLSKNAAMLTALSYGFGGYLIASLNTLNNLSAQIWLPAALWASNLWFCDRAKTGLMLAPWFLCFGILGGEPQLFLLTCGVLIGYGMVAGRSVNACMKNIGLTLAMIAVSLMLSMVQLGPSCLDFHQSIRSGGMPFPDATQNSMSLVMIKHLLIPLIFRSDFTTDPGIFSHFFPGREGLPWLLTVYPGFLILPLACIGAAALELRKKAFWSLLFGLSLVLALGRRTPLYGLFYTFLPFFRYPDKFMFLGGFSLLVLAAYGHDALLRNRSVRETRLQRLFLLLPALLFVDLYLAHHNLNPTCDSAFYRHIDPNLEPLAEDPETFRIYVDPELESSQGLDTIQKTHFRWQTSILPNLGVLSGLHHVDGKTGLELKYQYLITEILERDWAQKIQFLRLSNVKYIVSSRPLERLTGLEKQVKKIRPQLYHLTGWLPRAYLTGRLRPYPAGIDSMIDPSFDPMLWAMGPESLAAKYDRKYFQAIDRIFYRSNHHIEIEAWVEQPAVLVFSEAFYPGWRVFVDGREETLHRVNLLFQGVEVVPGNHRIEFKYRPPYFVLYAAVSVSSCLVFASICFLWLPRWKNKPGGLRIDDRRCRKK